MEVPSFSLRSNLKDIEEQVRHMLDQVRRGNAMAFARWYSVDPEARTRQPRKADIQYVIAREHGFKSWQSLKGSLRDNAATQSHSLRQRLETRSGVREPNLI
jgi:hypothetical protein